MEASATATRAGDFRVMSLVGFAHATSHFFHLVIPSLFPWLMVDFALTFTRAGTLPPAFFVVSGLRQPLPGSAPPPPRPPPLPPHALPPPPLSPPPPPPPP